MSCLPFKVRTEQFKSVHELHRLTQHTIWKTMIITTATKTLTLCVVLNCNRSNRIHSWPFSYWYDNIRFQGLVPSNLDLLQTQVEHIKADLHDFLSGKSKALLTRTPSMNTSKLVQSYIVGMIQLLNAHNSSVFLLNKQLLPVLTCGFKR